MPKGFGIENQKLSPFRDFLRMKKNVATLPIEAENNVEKKSFNGWTICET